MSLCYNPSVQCRGLHLSAFLLISEVQNTTNHVACVAGGRGGEGVREGDELEEIGKKESRSRPKLSAKNVRPMGGRPAWKGEERAPAIRASIGSILRLLTAAKFRLVNQTIAIGGVGRHSILLLGVMSR